MSLPIAARTVVFPGSKESGAVSDRPVATFGFQAGGGVRVPADVLDLVFHGGVLFIEDVQGEQFIAGGLRVGIEIPL